MGKADHKFKITTAIRSLLLDSPNVAALVGRSVFPILAEKGTEGDFITYQRDGYFIERSGMGIVRQMCKVFVSAVSADYERSVALAELIFETLEGSYTEPDMTIRLEDSTEEAVDGKYIQILLFSIE